MTAHLLFYAQVGNWIFMPVLILWAGAGGRIKLEQALNPETARSVDYAEESDWRQ